MTPGRDPALMSESERLSEIAELLGRAYLRLASRRKALEAGARPVALLANVNGDESSAKEARCQKA